MPHDTHPTPSDVYRAPSPDFAAIEDCREVALLWCAVRELVLPGRVSEATQRRILRRVWPLDPEISQGSYVDSPAH